MSKKAEQFKVAAAPALLVKGKWFLGKGDEVRAVVRARENGVVVFEPIAGQVHDVRYSRKKGFDKIVYLRLSKVQPVVPIEDKWISALTISSRGNLV